MAEGLLYDQREDRSVICHVCPWECTIPEGGKGRCLVRQNREGTLQADNYGLVSAAAVEPVERRGVYHMFPGCLVLTLGGWGNTLACRHRPAAPPMPAEKARFLDAERAASFAVEKRCRGLAWNYQEPIVWLEYVLDSAKLARANGLFTMLYTNGYATQAALDLIGPYLDAYIVEILAAEAAPYQRLCDLASGEAILEGTVHMQRQWRCHVEIHTPLIPGVNDGEEIVRGLAGWIRDSLGADVPWHLWAFEPAGLPAPTAEALEHARTKGREAGLHYVYIQAGDQIGLTPTLCPSCGQVLIRREGRFFIKVSGVEGNKCARCGQEISLRRSIFK